MEIRKKGEAALLRVLTANAEKQKRARIKQSYDEYIKQREAAVGQRKQTSSNTTSGKGTTRPVGQTRGLGTGINDFNDFTGKL
jgi:hypothetical protein